MDANDDENMIQTAIFEDLQRKIDEDSAIKDVRSGLLNLLEGV